MPDEDPREALREDEEADLRRAWAPVARAPLNEYGTVIVRLLATLDAERALSASPSGLPEQGEGLTPEDVVRAAWAFLDPITQQDYVGEKVDVEADNIAAFRRILRQWDHESALAASEPPSEGLDAERLRKALEMTLAELRRRERAAGKVIASDVAMFARAALDGLRLDPSVAARLREQPHVHTPTSRPGDTNAWCSTCGYFPLPLTDPEQPR